MQIKNIADQLIDAVDYTLDISKELLTGRKPRNIVALETVDSDSTLVCRGSTMLSVIELQGASSLTGSAEFSRRVSDLTNLLSTRLRDKSGHIVKVFFESDATQIKDELNRRLAGAVYQSKAMGVDLSDIYREKVDVNAEFCSKESCYICLYTTPAALGGDERKSADKRALEQKKSLPNFGKSQKLSGYIQDIRKIHEATTQAVLDGLEHADLQCGLITSHRALRLIVSLLMGAKAAEHWEADIVQHGNDREDLLLRRSAIRSEKRPAPSEGLHRYFRRSTEANENTIEPALPRPLSDQLITEDAYVVDKYIVYHDRVYAPVHVTSHAQTPSDFDVLVSRLKKTPFRVCFTMTTDGMSARMVDRTLASTFPWMSDQNKQIRDAFAGLKHYKNDDGCVVGFSIVATTWAPLKQSVNIDTGQRVYDLGEVEKNVNNLLAAFNDWGGIQAAATTVDPLEALFATVPGLVTGHVTNIVPAPLPDVISMLPISRVKSSWNEGAVLLRTADGTPISYEQMSPEQSAWTTIVCGPMGKGKSSIMNSFNLSFIAQQAGSADLPYLRGIDFGYSASGIVDIVRSALPADQKHRAAYVRMKNDPAFATNVFDTPLGSRLPIQNHVSFLENFLLTLGYSLREYKSLPGLARMCVKEAYARYSDDDHNTGAKRYNRNACPEVDAQLDKLGISALEGETTWWSLVDQLHDAGDNHTAALAQRYAVPVLEDLVSISASPNVKAEYSEDFGGQPITELFSRAIREAIDALPFLRSVTHFDISQSEVVILDLAEIVPSGASLSSTEKIKAATIYMVAMRLLTADFFMDLDFLPYFNTKYRDFHEQRIKRLTTLKKRFFCDERQRMGGIDTAIAQCDQYQVEGRKFFIDVMQGSQVYYDFSQKSLSLANTVIICGAGSQDDVEGISNHYELNATQRDALTSLRGPVPGKGAPMLIKFSTKRAGEQWLHAVNTEGALMLCALATEAADRYVRDQLYKRLPSTALARKAFATAFPQGTVKSEAKRREDLQREGLYESKTGMILDDIVQELSKKYLTM